ncbi:MAG: glycine cleavage system aminomethyltransferase GcvT [Verrucomicrobia bacterium]|nr:glycine cleavage system aminomethyltransferase GcvT [bacterium]NDA25248.1 glycine cleavage system aminomethyltransferase GcvT [Verrucomicrobiota bacterium]NDD56130.1 glycine cleavage system aminomethyltransferase GcvT [Verrucomicrobiota bacterium]
MPAARLITRGSSVWRIRSSRRTREFGIRLVYRCGSLSARSLTTPCPSLGFLLMSDAVSESPLAPCHQAAGGRMIPFAGWNLPVQFSGLIQEHQATRQAAGLFDISHMGQIRAQGPGALACLEGLLANDPSKLSDGEGHYSFLTNDRGGVADDLFLYRLGPEDFFLVVNASRHKEVLDGLKRKEGPQVRFTGAPGSAVGMALQGPKAAKILAKLVPQGTPLPERNRISHANLEGRDALVARTGYTGEDGFEIFADLKTGPKIWTKLLELGKPEGLLPCGLGARDSLRLEAGLPLNGQDLSHEITPVEAGLGFFVDVGRPRPFPGRSILENQKKNGPARITIALRGEVGQPPPRHGYPVFFEGKKIGEITSGLPSPTLGHGIALALVNSPAPALGQLVDFEVRGRNVPAKVCKRKFLKNK